MKKHPFGTVHIVGSTSTLKPTPEVARLLNQSGNITTFYRVLTKDNQMYYSRNYFRVKARNSFTVGFKDDGSLMFGQILYFTISDSEPVAIVTVFTSSSSETEFKLTFSSLDSRVFPVTATSIVKVVPVCNIIEKCIYISIGNEAFIARFTSQINLD